MNLSHHLIKVTPQFVDTDSILGGDKNTRSILLRNPAVLKFF